MKSWKRTATLSVLTAAVALSIPVAASAAGNAPAVRVNGQLAQTNGNYLSKDGKVYADVAAFAKAAGLSYTLNAADKSVTIGGKDVAAEIKNGAPYAYIRDLAAAAGASGVEWDSRTQTAQVRYGAKLIVYGDTVSSLGDCVQQNRFAAGDAIVFRMTAQNSVTGQLDEAAKLQVHLSTGEVLDMQFGEHPPGAPGAEKFWSVKYDVTDQTPKGTLNYYVTAEDGALTGEYKPFNVMPSLLTIVPADPGADAAADQGAE